MSNGSWRIEFVEIKEKLPVLWRQSKAPAELGPPPGQLSISALMSAFNLLARRGSGENPWNTFYRQDPVAFLLDAIGDAISVWRQGGELVYRNRAAEQLGFGWHDEVAHEMLTSAGQQFERRCLHFNHGNADYVLEVVREEHEPDNLSKSRTGSGQTRSRRRSK